MTAPTFVPPFRQLVEGVAAYFAAQDLGVVVARGWKQRIRQDNQGRGGANRVVFMGSKPDGSAGAITTPRQPGNQYVGEDPELPDYSIRALSDWNRVVQVSVWAFDSTSANDEGAQDDALWSLFTWVQRAVQSIAFGNAIWGAVKISLPEERPFGLELIAELSFQSMIPDLPIEVTRPNAVATKQGQP